MKEKFSNDSLCWEMAMQYFQAMDKEHIIRMIQHAANRQNEINELDS